MKEVKYIADLVSYGAGSVEFGCDLCFGEYDPVSEWADEFFIGGTKPFLSLELIDVLENEGEDIWYVYVLNSIDLKRAWAKRNKLEDEMKKSDRHDEYYQKCIDAYNDMDGVIRGEYPEWKLAAFRMVGPGRLRLYYTYCHRFPYPRHTIEFDVVHPGEIGFLFRELDANSNPNGREHRLFFKAEFEYYAQALDIDIDGKTIRKYDFGYNQDYSVFENGYDRRTGYDENQKFVLGSTLITEITLD